MRAPSAPAIELRQVSKRYPNGTLANSEVSLEVAQGEIHALVGENGAGKSTVMKMLFGLEQPSAGEIWLRGAPVRLRSPRDAMAQRIGLVPQHLELVASFSVVQNVVLGAEPVRGLTVDRQRARAEVAELSHRFGLEVDPDAEVSRLSAGEQQRVEILKALYRGAELLLLDEPSALLSPQESQALFAALRKLVEQGRTVMLITHKLAEVRNVSDSYTVMRGGRVTGRGRSASISDQAFGEMIVGRAVPSLEVARRTGGTGMARLAVRDLVVDGPHGRPHARPQLDGLSLDIAAGEIVGIAGVEGNGQSVLADVLSGLRQPAAGTVTLDGQPCPLGDARRMRDSGVSIISEDRLHDGVAVGMTIAENLMAADYGQPPCARRGGWLDTAAARARAEGQIADYAVAARTADDALGALSGGNMQKVVMARELSTAPRLLVACQPTRGVDIGAAQFLRQRLVQLRDSGAAVLLLSSDLDEILALSDRVAVLRKGRIVGHFPADAEVREIGLYMTGARGEVGVPATLGAPWEATA
jgi:ABC-type uncharacterized transport system ATPase subunit